LASGSAQTLEGKQFHGDRHQHCASGATPALAVPHAAPYGFVHLNVSGQHRVPGMTHCAPEPVQHRPGRLIGAESKDSMPRFGGNAIVTEGSCQVAENQMVSGVLAW
jgi:hypothetical protein